MAMKIQGQVTVDASRQDVWELFFDTEQLKGVLNKIPGIQVERLVQVADDKYEATATMGVAMIKGKYDGTIVVTEKRALEYVKFRGEGKGSGNWTSGDMALTLTEQEGKTLITYEGNGNVGGALASVGQRMIDTVGKQFVQQGARALAAEFAARSRSKQAVPAESTATESK